MENQWSNNIRNFARQTLQEWRDIADAIADVLRWIGRGFLAVHYRIDGAICALFEPKDPKRFAQKPGEYWHEKPKSGKKEVPKQEPVKGTKLHDEKGNARAVALDFDLMEQTEDRAAHFEAEVLWGEVAHIAKGGNSEITEAEWWQMQHYSKKQRLSNIAVAKEVKKHWLLGKTSAQIAADSGLLLDSVKKYVACFVRAEKHSPNGETDENN